MENDCGWKPEWKWSTSFERENCCCCSEDEDPYGCEHLDVDDVEVAQKKGLNEQRSKGLQHWLVYCSLEVVMMGDWECVGDRNVQNTSCLVETDRFLNHH